MSKKFRFKGLFDKWHGKRVETLLKSERQYLYHIYWSFWSEFSRKKCVLVIFKIIRLLFKPLTSNGKNSLLKCGNLLQHLQMQLSQKQKILNFFFAFFQFRFTFERFQRKKMTLTSYVFLNLRTRKYVVR